MRSEEVKLGSTRAAHRSLFYAMGYTEEDLKKPLIGVVNAQNEIIPGHMHLDQIAKAVKHGILAAGGTPIEFPAIGICDGIAMGHNGMKYPLASANSSTTFFPVTLSDTPSKRCTPISIPPLL